MNQTGGFNLMDASELLNFKWKNLSGLNWEKIPDTYCRNERSYYTKESVEIFVESVFRGIARELGVPFEEIRNVLEEENKPFFRELNRVFKEMGTDALVWSYISDLRQYFFVPDVQKIAKMRRFNHSTENGLYTISWWKNLLEKAERIFSPNKNQGLLPAPSHESVQKRIISDFTSLSHEERTDVLKTLHGIIKDSQDN